MNADLDGARAPLHALRPLRLACAVALAAGSLVSASSLHAQDTSRSTPADPREMTVEQLEQFIADQKEALEVVRENRDITAEKAREVRAALEEKEAERLEAEAEMKALCEEREALEPGSMDDCLATLAEE